MKIHRTFFRAERVANGRRSPVADQLVQRRLGQHQIGGVLLDPGGNHGAVDQGKNRLRGGHALLRPKAEPSQVLRVKPLPVLVDLLAGGLYLLVQVDRFNGDHRQQQRGEIPPAQQSPRQTLGHAFVGGQRRFLGKDVFADAADHLVVAVSQRFLHQLDFPLWEVVIEATLGDVAPRQQLGQRQTIVALSA